MLRISLMRKNQTEMLSTLQFQRRGVCFFVHKSKRRANPRKAEHCGSRRADLLINVEGNVDATSHVSLLHKFRSI